MLIFDGDCGFCTSAVQWLGRLLPAFPAAVPYQWTDLESLGLTEAEAAARVWFVSSAQQFGGHLAVAALLRAQPGFGFRFLGWLGVVPPWSWAADVAYRLVARFRHRLPGGTAACQLKPRP